MSDSWERRSMHTHTSKDDTRGQIVRYNSSTPHSDNAMTDSAVSESASCKASSNTGHTCSGHHDHAAHADLDTADGRKRVAVACVITVVFAVVEAIGGIISGSLALLADAAHMLTDSASLALAWLGYWFAAKAPDDTRSFGFGRMRVLAAFVNGIALLALAVWIMVEGLMRLLDPQPVASVIMLIVAIGGLVVNLVAAHILHGGDNDDINLSGALLHVLGDLLGSVAAIAAAMVIMLTNWTPVDPLLSILVSLLVFVAGVRITKRAGHILLQGAPDGSTPAVIRSKLIEQFSEIQSVQPIHVWQLTEDKLVATVCIKAVAGTCVETLRLSVKQYLQNKLHLHLVTVEVIGEPQTGNLAASGQPSANDSNL